MKKALVVVDFQKDFVDGSLGFAAAPALDGVLAARIDAVRREGGDVFFTLDTHDEGYLGSREGRALPVTHCRRGTEGWALYGQVAARCMPGSPVFEKGAFGSLPLARALADGGYDEVELAGLVSNICVLSNAVLAQAALPQARIVVNAALTDSYDPALHEKALDILEGLQIEVIRPDKV